MTCCLPHYTLHLNHVTTLSTTMNNDDTVNNWGGKRTGAGRKPNPEALATVVKRVPKALVPMLDEAILALKNQDNPSAANDHIPLNALKPVAFGEAANIPLASEKVPAGIPSPVDSHVEEYMDLNQYLIQHPEHTFMVRAGGDSMEDAGIDKEDLLVIDRSLKPRHRDIVMADTGNDFTIKRLHLQGGVFELHPENEATGYAVLKPKSGENWYVVGVVTAVIKTLR